MCDRTEADQPLKELRREQANARGRLYPAFGDAPAIVEGVGYPLRMVTPEDLEGLRRHGVPVGLAAQCCNRSASWTIGLLWGDRRSRWAIAAAGHSAQRSGEAFVLTGVTFAQPGPYPYLAAVVLGVGRG